MYQFQIPVLRVQSTLVSLDVNQVLQLLDPRLPLVQSAVAQRPEPAGSAGLPGHCLVWELWDVSLLLLP